MASTLLCHVVLLSVVLDCIHSFKFDRFLPTPTTLSKVMKNFSDLQALLTVYMWGEVGREEGR